MLSGDEKLREELGNLYGDVSVYDGRPTESQVAESERLLARLGEALGGIDRLIDGELGDLNSLLERRGKEPLARLSREDWEARDAGGSSAGKVQRRRWSAWLQTQVAVRH